MSDVLNSIGSFFKKLWNSEFVKKIRNSSSFTSIIASLLSIVVGLIFGLIIMIVIAALNKDSSISDAFGGLKIILSGPFSSKIAKYRLTNTGDMIFYAAPLIMTGLSVALAYKTGLFNIGAPGQYVMGTVGALLVALSIPTSTRFEGIMVWLLAVVVGMLCGALWGIIPGFLKAYFNINEVIVCIMTNWIAANAATWLFTNTVSLHSTENTKGAYLTKVINNYTPKLGLDKLFPGSYIDIGIILAIIIAVLIYIMLNKTTFGYELKACGSNKNAAKYAGLSEKRNIVLSMAIAGALSGLAACLYYLNPGLEYNYVSQYTSLPTYGFNGIASAFLASCNPVGIVFSSLFIRYLNAGGEALVKVGFNRYVADIIISIIIYLAGFTMIIKEILYKRKRNKETKEKAIKHDEVKADNVVKGENA